MLKKIIGWFNLPYVVNQNFEALQEQIDALESRVEELENA